MLKTDTHEMLFLIAVEFVNLTDKQKLEIGMKLGLVDLNAYCYPSQALSEIIFTNAYKKNKIYKLIQEIGKIKP